MTPSRLAPGLRSLPPMLHIPFLRSMSGCSKAPRGLFVLLRVTSIFTRTSISPSPSSRQRPSRYAFPAGRNLPDKGFRYLRTVIVTAAVHWGFSSELALLPLTFQHWAGVSPYTSSYDFSRDLCFCWTVARATLLQPQSAWPARDYTLQGTPSPEVTELDCRVP